MTDETLSLSGGEAGTWWRRLSSGGVVGIEAGALALATIAWTVPIVSAGAAPPAWAVGASAAILLALVATLLSNHGVRAMAWQTFAQCMRMKVAVAFMVILAAALAVLPSFMTGDGTLAGAIRSLLAYGTSVTAVLLSVVTVLLGSSVVCGDVRNKQIFLTATKPLARWQYVLGRWLGVVLLDALLLGMAMGTVYALAQHLRDEPERLGGEDRRVVETEIFTARDKVFPNPVDIEDRIRDRVESLKAHNEYKGAVEAWQPRVGGDPDRAEQALLADIRKQISTERNSAGPGGMMYWGFAGIHVAGQRFDLRGTVESIDAPVLQVRIRIEPGRSRKMVYQTPVHIDDVDGSVEQSGDDFLVVGFYAEDNFARLDPRHLMGREVTVVVDPAVQVTYKPSTTSDLPDSIVTSVWVLTNPETHVPYGGVRRDPPGRPNTLTVTSRAVDSNGNVEVLFRNQTATSVRIDPTDIYVLFVQGGFEWNYFRATLLLLLQLAFLAALAVLAGSFLSFPVAVLLSLSLLFVAIARPFLASSVELSTITAPGVDLLTRVGYLLMQIMTVLLPDFASTWPTDSLVDGLHISWTWLGETACLTVGVRTLAVLALCCLIFRKRELARVQV